MEDIDYWLNKTDDIIRKLEYLSSSSGKIHDCNSFIGLLAIHQVYCMENPVEEELESLKKIIVKSENYLVKMAKEIKG